MYLVGSLYKDQEVLGAMTSNKIGVVINSDTTTVGAILDLQGFARVLLNMFTCTVTDGDYEWKLFHGDDSNMSDEAEVSDSDLNGTLVNWVDDTDDDKVVNVEYIARKRYIRVKIVSTNTASGVNIIGCIALLGQPTKSPEQT